MERSARRRWLVALAVVLGSGPALFALADEDPMALAVIVQGKVEHRAPGRRWAPLGKGARLAAGVELRLARGARVKLLCADGFVEGKGSRTMKVPGAPPARTSLWSRLVRFLSPKKKSGEVPGAVRSDKGRPGFVDLVSPRYTTLMGLPVELRWAAVKGAARYEVIIDSNEGEEVLRRKTGETRLLLGKKSKLKPGDYYWRVKPGLKGAVAFPTEGVRFTVLGDEERSKVEAELKAAGAAGGTEEDRLRRALSRAAVYEGHNLLEDAVREMEAVQGLGVSKEVGVDEMTAKLRRRMGRE